MTPRQLIVEFQSQSGPCPEVIHVMLTALCGIPKKLMNQMVQLLVLMKLFPITVVEVGPVFFQGPKSTHKAKRSHEQFQCC